MLHMHLQYVHMYCCITLVFFLLLFFAFLLFFGCIVVSLLFFCKGEFDDTVANSVILKAVVHWNYKSISRGPTSLCGKLIDIDGGERFFFFYCPVSVDHVMSGEPCSST